MSCYKFDTNKIVNSRIIIIIQKIGTEQCNTLVNNNAHATTVTTCKIPTEKNLIQSVTRQPTPSKTPICFRTYNCSRSCSTMSRWHSRPLRRTWDHCRSEPWDVGCDVLCKLSFWSDPCGKCITLIFCVKKYFWHVNANISSHPN